MIAIIGAGVSGLATAFYLQQRHIPYVLLEASDRAGGYISSVREGEYLFEQGPNSLLCDQDVWEILADLALATEVQHPNQVSSARFILKDGAYRKLSPKTVFLGNFFDVGTKRALVSEWFRRSKAPENETVADFFRRRFSEQLVQYAVNPFVAGIYAGDPEQLLMRFTFPALYQAERTHGSLIRGMMQQKSGAKRKQSVSFPEGMQALPRRLAERVEVHYNTPVTSLERKTDGFLINETHHVRAVVVTTPARATAAYIASVAPAFSKALESLSYPPMCVVHSVFAKEAAGFAFNGFGGLHPAAEKRFTAGSIWSSSLFTGRAPEGEVLLTTFVGGAQASRHTALPDEQLLANVTDELRQLFNLKNLPKRQRLFRWPKAIPQYDVQLLGVERHIPELMRQSIYVNANWWGGVSVADCLKKGRALAQQLAETHP